MAMKRGGIPYSPRGTGKEYCKHCGRFVKDLQAHQERIAMAAREIQGIPADPGAQDLRTQEQINRVNRANGQAAARQRIKEGRNQAAHEIRAELETGIIWGNYTP